MSDATPGILDGIRILDLSTGIAGPTATMVLAEAGADVVKVEPPTGDPTRSRPGFLTWNRSKRSVVVDMTTEAGRTDLDRLIAAADVLVHSYGPSEARSLRLDDATLAAANPTLIVSSVLGWPVNHADADRPASDHLTLARLGVLDEQQGVARGDGPIYVRVPLGSWGAVWLAACGIMARLVLRGRTGHAGPAHTSLAQGALIPMMMHWSRSENPSPGMANGMPKKAMGATLFECSDGEWIHVMPNNLYDAPLLKEVLAELSPEALAEAAKKDGPLPHQKGQTALGVAIAQRPSRQWLEHFWAHDVPVQPALPLGGIFFDEQARINQYVVEHEDPTAGRITAAGLPLTVTPPTRVRSAAPALGADSASVLAEWEPRPRPAAPRSPAPRFPLEGMRLLDFGNFLAGPLGPMLLADLGMDVIKVEAATGDPMRPQDWPFAGCQRGKRSVSLDLKSPETRPILDELIRGADIVHHNLRMPAARRLGLDYEAVKAINSDVIFCHTSSYGPTGPRADWPGYDQLFQSSCGWEVMGAGVGNRPMWHRFGFMDHMCAMSSVVATLLAVFHQDRTGEPQAVAASLLGAGVMTCSETFIDPDGQLVPIEMLDQPQLGVTPGARIFELADGWIATNARTAPELAGLAVVAGLASAEDPAAVAATLADRTCDDVLATLAAAGVPAERVRQEQRYPFFDDPNHQAAGMIASYQHAEWGRLEQPGAMWSFGDLGVQLHLAPPALGEHTVEVLYSIGVDDVEIDRLVKAGAATVHRR